MYNLFKNRKIFLSNFFNVDYIEKTKEYLMDEEDILIEEEINVKKCKISIK